MERVKAFRLIAACLFGLLVSTGYLMKVRSAREEISGMGQSAEALVAARPLALGDRLSDGALEVRRIPRAFVPKRALLSRDRSLVAEQALIHPVPEGDPVLWSDLADGPRQRRPTESIPDGLRSFSLPADEIHMQAHLLVPGDTVDILWTHIPQGSAAPRTDVVAQRTQILAVGRRVARETAPDAPEAPTSITLLVPRELGVLLATCLVSGEITFVGRGRSALDETPASRAAEPGGNGSSAEGGL